MDVTKPYKFIRLGAMDVTKPYKFITFGLWMTPDRINSYALVDVTNSGENYTLWCHGCHQTYEFIWFGAMYVTKPYNIYTLWCHGCHQTL